MVHSAFQVYILLLLCIFILLIFENLNLKSLIIKKNYMVELYVSLFSIFQVSY